MRRTRQIRGFSSPSSRTSSLPSSSGTPALVSGWAARVGRLERNLERLPRFLHYVESEAFASSLSVAHHARIFCGLNAPQRLDLDVPEFLHGAKLAFSHVMEDAHSHDFIQFTRCQHLPIAPSAVVDRMRSYCLPRCFEQLQTDLLRIHNHDHNDKKKRTMVNIDIEGASLTRVCYAQLMERQYQEELAGAQLLFEQDESREEDANEQPTVERLQLQVEVRTLERIQEISPSKLSTSTRARELLQRKVYVARFISQVTRPEEIDWRIAYFALRTKGPAMEVGKTIHE